MEGLRIKKPENTTALRERLERERMEYIERKHARHAATLKKVHNAMKEGINVVFNNNNDSNNNSNNYNEKVWKVTDEERLFNIPNQPEIKNINSIRRFYPTLTKKSKRGGKKSLRRTRRKTYRYRK